MTGSRVGYRDSRKNKPTGLRILLSIKGDIIADQTASRGGFYGTDYSKAWLSAVGSSYPAGIIGTGITVFSMGLCLHLCQTHQAYPSSAPEAESTSMAQRSQKGVIFKVCPRETPAGPPTCLLLHPRSVQLGKVQVQAQGGVVQTA